MKAQLDKNQKAITKKLHALVPDATAIIFFGSRVSGLPAPTSDYDVLVLTPTGVEEQERARIQATLKKSLPVITVDMAFGSERWMLANLSREPHLRFWLENGIATYGQVPRVFKYPSLYKEDLQAKLDLLRARRILYGGWSRTLYGQARGYLRILKEVLLIEHAIRQDYGNESLWKDITEFVGVELLAILRDPTLRFRIRKPMVLNFERRLNRKLNAVRREINTSELPSLVTLERT